MNNNFDLNQEFFVIASNNLNTVNSHLYGYCIVDGKVIETFAGLNGKEPTSDGCYVYVQKSENIITIKQDFIGCYGIYLYQNKDYFALSNSFMHLVEYIKTKKPITFNKDYANYFVSCGLCSSSKTETLVNEITVVDRSAVITIDSKKKTLSQTLIDYHENTMSLDSKEGMATLDHWFMKWTKLIKYLIVNEEQTMLSLSGGFDSRIPFLLALKSGCNMNKILVHSSTDGLHTHSEDLEIAMSIADRFGFQLNNNSIIDNAAFNYSLSDSVNISFYVCAGFHNRFQNKRFFFKKRVFDFGGRGGECLRDYWNKDEKIYLKNQIRRANRFGSDAAAIKKSIERILKKSIAETYEKFQNYGREIMPEQLTLNLYRETRNRTHFGKEIVENYFVNKFSFSPLLDQELHKLKLTIPDCNDMNLLFAVIIDRFCPELLSFPFEGGRTISEEAINTAKKLNHKYPANINYNIDISKATSSHYKPVLKKDIDELDKNAVNKLFCDSFTSNHVYHRFVSIYSDYTYKWIEHIMNNEKYSPFHNVRMAISICKILDDVSANQYINRTAFEYLDSTSHSNRCEMDIIKSNYNIIKRYITGRIDIKNAGTQENDISFINISDKNIDLSSPKWNQNNNGKSYVLQTVTEDIIIKLKCIRDGRLIISLRGVFVKDDLNRNVPIWIDYKSLSVNDNVIFDKTTPVCHDRPYYYSMAVQDGEILTIRISYAPHDMKNAIESIQI